MAKVGKSANGFIKFVFVVVVTGLITACYITVTLIVNFIGDDVIYSGIIFSILGFLLELVAFSYYIIMFKDELRSY